MIHLCYLRYLARHKWFVLVAGYRLRVPLWRLVVHDWSKLLPCEWVPYARYFYGADPTGEPRQHWDRPNVEENKNAEMARRQASFDRAWLHHQHVNPHHWQHWLLKEDSGASKMLPMPERLVREMVADWMGAGRAVSGRWDVRSWYEKNAGIIMLHEQTRRRVHELLGIEDQS